MLHLRVERLQLSLQFLIQFLDPFYLFLDTVLLGNLFGKVVVVGGEESCVLVVLGDHGEEVESAIDALTLLTVVSEEVLQVALDVDIVAGIGQVAGLADETLLHLLVQVSVIGFCQTGCGEQDVLFFELDVFAEDGFVVGVET